MKSEISSLLKTGLICSVLSMSHAWAACPECGVVQGVNSIEKKGDSSGLVGAAAGGVVGGLLGRQVGKGRGKDVATVAGVVGGAVVGNQIEKSMDKKTVYEMSVKMEDGSVRTANFDSPPVFRAGDKVKVVNDQFQLNN